MIQRWVAEKSCCCVHCCCCQTFLSMILRSTYFIINVFYCTVEYLNCTLFTYILHKNRKSFFLILRIVQRFSIVQYTYTVRTVALSGSMIPVLSVAAWPRGAWPHATSGNTSSTVRVPYPYSTRVRAIDCVLYRINK